MIMVVVVVVVGMIMVVMFDGGDDYCYTVGGCCCRYAGGATDKTHVSVCTMAQVSEQKSSSSRAVGRLLHRKNEGTSRVHERGDSSLIFFCVLKS